MVFVPIIVLGSDVIAFVFGAGYMAQFTLVGWLSMGMAVRFMRARMVNAFLAVGSTKDLMLSETARILGIIFAFVALMMGGDLVAVGMAMLGGELIAYWVCVVRLRALGHGAIETRVETYGGALAAMALAVAVITFVPGTALTRFGAGTVIVLVYMGLHFQFVPMMREQLKLLPDLAARMLQSRS
jgi:O-antigen/teichoic acid export membrane protein